MISVLVMWPNPVLKVRILMKRYMNTQYTVTNVIYKYHLKFKFETLDSIYFSKEVDLK